MSIAERAQAEQEYLVARRRDFHAHPEISMQEFRTAQRIEEELDKLGIPHQRSGATGVYAEIKGAKPGTGVIALRADIDALAITETHEVPYKSQTPGVMHACGHDSHAAALLGAAKLLEAERQNFGGTIRLFFQPGEEIGKGAKEFIRDGHLDGVQRVFGLHAASDLPVGTIGVTPGSNNAAVDGFRIIVHGVNAHVSTPQLGADALYIASQIVVAAQALTTRTLTPETRAAVRQQLDALAKQTAALYGAEAEVEWTDITPALINPAAFSAQVAAQAGKLDGVTVTTNRPVSLGGDNFAEYQQKVPGVYAYLGTRDPENPNTALAHHNDGFDIGEKALPYGAALYAQVALWWLQEGAEQA